MFENFKRSYQFKYAYNCLRAYKHVKSKEGEKYIFFEADVIQMIPILKNEIGAANNNISLTQKMLHENLNGLSSVIMLARYGYKGKVILPYTKSWRRHLISIGIKPHILSAPLFLLNVYRKFKDGVCEFRRLNSYSTIFDNNGDKYISFIGFPLNSLDMNINGELDNFLNYAQRKFPNNNLVFVSTVSKVINAKSTIANYPFPAFQTRLQNIKFILLSIFTIVKSLIEALIGKWESAYLLKDIIQLNYVKLLDIKNLPQKVIFSNSHYIYKPIWTNQLAQDQVALLFYSTNTYNIKFETDEYGIAPGYKNMNWGSYYTFHTNHRDFIQKIVGKKVTIQIENAPINLTDKAQNLNFPVGLKVALFDVQPFRDGFLSLIGRPSNIYDYNASKFIFMDIIEWCISNNVYLILKQKREVNKRLCKQYARLLELIQSSGKCIIVDSMYSPRTISKLVDAVICQPFTSAALSAVYEGKPVVYYDPVSSFIKDQPACQGVQLLNEKAELHGWLSNKVLSK